MLNRVRLLLIFIISYVFPFINDRQGSCPGMLLPSESRHLVPSSSTSRLFEPFLMLSFLKSPFRSGFILVCCAILVNFINIVLPVNVSLCIRLTAVAKGYGLDREGAAGSSGRSAAQQLLRRFNHHSTRVLQAASSQEEPGTSQQPPPDVITKKVKISPPLMRFCLFMLS